MNTIDRAASANTLYDCFNSPIAAVEDLNNRIWNAVSNFFTWIIDTITDYYRAVVQYFYPPTINLIEKIAPFQNMPDDPLAFLNCAYDIHERFLNEEKRAEFREEFEEMINPSEIALAILRAYIFSNSHRAFTFIEDHCNEMRRLQSEFFSLSESDQIAIIDKTDFGGVRTMPISVQAKEMLNRLHAICNEITQGHRGFLTAFGELHSRVFP